MRFARSWIDASLPLVGRKSFGFVPKATSHRFFVQLVMPRHCKRVYRSGSDDPKISSAASSSRPHGSRIVSDMVQRHPAADGHDKIGTKLSFV